MYKPHYLHNWSFVELQSQKKLVWALNPKLSADTWQAQALIVRGCFMIRSLLTPAFCDILFIFVIVVKKKINSVPMHYFSSQVYNTHKHSLLHHPDQYLLTSQSLGQPRDQSGKKAPWLCEILSFFNGDRSAIKCRVKMIRPLQGSDLCHWVVGNGGDLCTKPARPSRLWKCSICY